jgi:hypothetical protein
MVTPYPDPHQKAHDTRQRVLAMASSMKAATQDMGVTHPQFGGKSPAQAVELFLALLQDRLPMWLRVLDDLKYLAGKGIVADNLLPITRAGIDYYAEIHGAALPAFVSPAITVRFREAMRSKELGPAGEITPLTEYLEVERNLGRICPDVDTSATARLLLAGCFRHAYMELFIGADVLPSRDETAEEIVRELRLGPCCRHG